MSSKTGLVKLSSSTTSSCRTGTDGKLSLYVLRNGAALIGFGLIYGFVIPYTPFPRLALTAHIQFAVEGTMVVAAGLLLQSDPLSSRSINDKASTELVPLADRLNNWQRRVVIIGIASVWATLLTEAANAWWGTRWILVIAHQAAGLVGKESASQWMEWAILATHFPLVLLPLVAMWPIFLYSML